MLTVSGLVLPVLFLFRMRRRLKSKTTYTAEQPSEMDHVSADPRMMRQRPLDFDDPSKIHREHVSQNTSSQSSDFVRPTALDTIERIDFRLGAFAARRLILSFMHFRETYFTLNGNLGSFTFFRSSIYLGIMATILIIVCISLFAIVLSAGSHQRSAR